MAPVAVTVDLWISAAWVDITAYARVVDGGITIKRGTANEAGTADASLCSLSLNNRDGRFSPRNPMSPYYGLIGRNTLLRVKVGASVRFIGEVSSWPSRWNTAGTDVWVPIEAAGVLRRLSQGASALESPIRRALSSNANLIGYWPLEDEVGSTSFVEANSLAGPALSTGTPDLEAETGWIASKPTPTTTWGELITGYPPEVSGSGWTAGCMVCTPANDGIYHVDSLLTIQLTGGTIGTVYIYRAEAYGGNLDVYGTDRYGGALFNGAALSGAPFTTLNPSLNSGSRFLVTLSATTSGADTIFVCTYVPDGSYGYVGTSQTMTFTVVGQSRGRIKSVEVGAQTYYSLSTAAVTSFGHMFAAAHPTPISNYNFVTGHISETASARFARLATEEGVAYDLDEGTVTSALMGVQKPLKLVDLLRECEAADRGMLHDGRNAAELRYVSRSRLYPDSVTPVVLDYDDGDISPPFEPTDDDANTVNDVTVTRVDGSSAHVVQATGPLSILPPPAGVGRYENTPTLNVYADTQLLPLAEWIRHIGAWDESRYPQVRVDLIANPALVTNVAALDVGGWLTLADLPSFLTYEDTDQVILGYTETLSSFIWSVVFNCAPAGPYHVGIYNATGSRYDSGDSTLSAGITTTATSLSVAIVSGLWSTSAAPFAIKVGGERMTVTAVAGGASPQTFTVTRSVNGVVKAHLAGAVVALADPVLYAL